MSPTNAALIIVDLQNDFCDPDKGSLAVKGGALHLAEPVNELLNARGFVVRVATICSPPKHHKFHAHNHDGDKTHVDLPNAKDGLGHESYKQELWPAHCEPGTEGHKLIPGLEESKIDIKILKNQNPDVVMYSAFADRHGNHKHHQPEGAVTHHLEEELRERNVTDIFLVGSTGDYGVAHTAVDGAMLGFNTYVIEDLMGNLDHSGQEWEKWKTEFDGAGVKVIKSSDPIVKALEN